MDTSEFDQLCINTLRFLVADMVEEAQSGHPGTAMGIAPVAYTLWTRFLRYHPAQPRWFNRDRFVLSSGHASALLYSLLHLTGYGLTLEELKRFRKLHSRTPGHPENHLTPGVEITTGPLGQGFASAVGMALAEAHLAARFNRPDAPKIIDHFTYVLCSDGDMMEGISHEAASLAGHLSLGKLIAIYDDNQVTIEGPTGLTYSDDVAGRFRAYGWHVQHVGDANDLAAVRRAVKTAQTNPRPSLIIVRSLIGYGMPTRQGTAAAHFGALGEQELNATKAALNWPTRERFHIPPAVAAHFARAGESGAALYAASLADLQTYQQQYPAEHAQFVRMLEGRLPDGWEAHLPRFAPSESGEPTRMVNAAVVNALAGVLPELVGGSADLAPNTQTLMRHSADFSAANPAGRNLRFGVREHAMAAAVNGMALHGGLRPFGATFLVFSDYLRPSLRLAALSEIPSIFLFTNDSITLGEDGPTHQPVEHLASLRAIPNLLLLRPCDMNEAVQAWKVALENRKGPSVIALTRQPAPVLDRQVYAPAEGLERGAYVLSEAPGGAPQAILLAAGFEVHLALAAQKILAERGVAARVVSMPCWSLFEAQAPEYRQSVLPAAVRARVAIEAGAALGWERWVGLDGAVIAMNRFGASAPWQEVYREYGFTPQRAADAALALLGL